MPEFLSPAWIDALAHAAATGEAPHDAHLVLQQVVSDGDGEVAYAVRIGGGRIEVTPGRVPDADLTFTQDRATAGAIARGELSAQAAFLEGRLRVGGDLAAARTAARTLTVLTDLFAAPRGSTSW